MKYITKEQIKFPKRKKESRKGENGEVLIVGGSEDYVGCLTLAGLAALRTGVDWVTVAAPEKVAWAVNCLTPNLITKKIKGKFLQPTHVKEIVDLSTQFDAVLIGNGIGRKTGTERFLKTIVKRIKKLKVIDADGIKAISIDDVKDSILTPHLGELKILLLNSGILQKQVNKIIKQRDVKQKACLIKQAFKQRLKNNVLVVKGHIDIIISSDKVFYNKTGNPGMTQGGTGDVLSGLAAGFLAQNQDLLQSTINATYINGLIGDILLKKKKGYSFIASDMTKDIRVVLARLKNVK